MIFVREIEVICEEMGGFGEILGRSGRVEEGGLGWRKEGERRLEEK